MPKLIFEEFGVDYGVIGEGEETVVELIDSVVSNKDLKNVKGIIFKDANQVVITQRRNSIENLEIKILNLRIKFSKFTVPYSYERTSLHNYNLSVKCPYCKIH